MLGYMAGLLGCNAVINRFGELTIKKLNVNNVFISARQQYMNGYEQSLETPLTIDYLTTGTETNDKGNGGVLTVGNGYYGFNFENPYITTPEAAQNILDLYKSIQIMPGKIKYRGNPCIDCGDIVQAEDRNGNYQNILVLSQTFTVTGGFTATIDCSLKTDSKADFITTPSTKKLTQKFTDFERTYKDIIDKLTGVSGGYVKNVKDAQDNVRAIAICENDIDVEWDEINEKVIVSDSADAGAAMWVWSYGGLSYTSNGGYTYKVAINMAGEIYAELLVGKLSKFIELQAQLGTIGGWNIEEDALYSDYDYKTDSNGYNCYRVYLQSFLKNNGKSTWAISVQQGKKDSNGDFSGIGKFYVTYDGKCYCNSGLNVTGNLKMDSYLYDGGNYQVIGINNNLVVGYGSYTLNQPTYVEGGQVFLRHNGDGVAIQRQGTTRMTFNFLEWQFSNGTGYRDTINSTSGFVLSANSGNNAMYLVASQVRMVAPQIYSGGDLYNDGDLYLNFMATSGTVALAVNTKGLVTTTSSSERYKENITTELEDWLNPERLYDLPVKQYNYKSDYEDKELVAGTQIGIIAEDIEKYYPNALIRNQDGQAESWQERIMIPAMLKLIQRQKARIDNLETEQAKLNERITALENLITSLVKE